MKCPTSSFSSKKFKNSKRWTRVAGMAPKGPKKTNLIFLFKIFNLQIGKFENLKNLDF